MVSLDVLKMVDNIVGQEVRVINTFDTEYIGTIYTYNQTPGTLVLQIPGSNPVLKCHNYKVIRTSHIKSLEIINNQQTTQKPIPIEPINTSNIPAIIKANKERTALTEKTRNSKASKDGQFLFDIITNRIAGVEWGPHNSIIVLDEVKIEEPYTQSAIKTIGSDVNEDLVTFVSNVVKDVWRKIDNERKGG